MPKKDEDNSKKENKKQPDGDFPVKNQNTLQGYYSKCGVCEEQKSRSLNKIKSPQQIHTNEGTCYETEGTF